MNITTLIEKVVGDFGDKLLWREYKARVARMPEPYAGATRAFERYLTYYGGIAKGDVIVAMVNDLADLFERAAVDGTPIRAIVGDDPVGFAEDFLRTYEDGRWINKERRRLIDAIAATDAAGSPISDDTHEEER